MASRKILLVDDSETVLQIEQMILAKSSYELILARDDVPGTVLGAEDAPPVALGWATWINTAPRDSDADDTTFTL